MDYVPGPTDTSGVTLPEELRTLTELLAKNAHENWAPQRLAEGWRVRPSAERHPQRAP